jgi:eukaryotic-like serine/threonine-protein kinase
VVWLPNPTVQAVVKRPDTESWQRLDQLLEGALARPPVERQPFLREASAGDDELYHEVATLLDRVTEANWVLGESALEFAAPLLRVRGLDDAGPADSLLPGRQIASYRIMDEIGRGGMGVVYRARDIRLDRLVALKFLSPRLTDAEEARRRFLREARAASAIEHPNVASLYEIGETEDGRTYLVFACYEGETLKDRITRGPLPAEEALAVAMQVAAGLTAAHGKGVVHRDIKPGNVMLTHDGWVKILDFGLATMSGAAGTGASGRFGTVSYMSPERIRGEPVDARSDLWSLGVVLYEMLTGENPFRTGGAGDVEGHVLRASPGVLAADDRIPPALQPVIARALAPGPADRYPDASELLADLERAGAVGPQRRSPLQGPAGARSRARRLGKAVALSIVAVAAGWSLTSGLRTGVPDSLPQSIAVLPFVDLSEHGTHTYFGDGIAEAILGTLAGIAELRVISGTSVQRYRAFDTRLGDIAGELGVAHVVEGSVRREAGRVRVVVRLVDAVADRPLWSETYDRELADIFLVQSDIARRVAAALEVRLSPLERRRLEVRPTGEVAAYDLLLQASQYLRRYRREDNEIAIALLDRALAVDPGFALAHARRGGAFALKVFQYGDSYEWADSAHSAAMRAVALDPELAEGHHALGLAHLAREQYDQSLAALARATELNPGYWAAINVAGVVHWRRGAQDEALRWYWRGVDLDPVGYAPSLSTIAGSYALLGLFDEARAAIDRALTSQPDLPLAYLNAILLSLAKGRDAQAVEYARMLVTTSPGNARAWASAGTALQFAGDAAEARSHFERAYEISPEGFDLLRRYIPVLLGHARWAAGEPLGARALLEEFRIFAGNQMSAGNQGPFLRYNLAAVHVMLGSEAEALQWLEEAVAAGWTDHLLLSRDPLFVSLHGHEQFQRILAGNAATMDSQRHRVLNP